MKATAQRKPLVTQPRHRRARILSPRLSLSNSRTPLETRATSAGVVNVSDYPDIADLYLAADLLVTDYSSVMFDYATTSRPMVFHCPDLEHYRDDLRGWYFDLETDAPGPITRNAHELATAIRAGLSDQGHTEHREPYAAFRERFCSWERGDAAEQVADELVRALDWPTGSDAAELPAT
jgi:CDP-glycerol glycerophosphotransferase